MVTSDGERWKKDAGTGINRKLPHVDGGGGSSLVKPGNANNTRETLWLSPACLDQSRSLFGGGA